MSFIDETRLEVKGGVGGSGCVSMRREKWVPFGGPDGGDGGRGGSVILVGDRSVRTLADYRYRRHFKAQRGTHGMGAKRHGAEGADLLLRVPVGTVVFTDEGEQIADLVHHGESVVVAAGGLGGRGNAALATRKHSVPHFGEIGEPGVERWVRLELRLLADVGLVGLPNAGKSSLLAMSTAAKPKIAGYPFTTITPNLGVVELEDHRSFVMADIPGLIEGAHEGKGLGDRFLRHVRRSAVLLHVVDLSGDDPVGDMRTVRNELISYDPGLEHRPWMLAANKSDVNPPDEHAVALRGFLDEVAPASEDDAGWQDPDQDGRIPLFVVSAATGQGVREMLMRLADMVEAEGAADVPVSLDDTLNGTVPVASGKRVLRYVYKPPRQIEVTRSEDDRFLVAGEHVMRMVVMTDFHNEEALEHLQTRLAIAGVEHALIEAGARKGDDVSIGNFNFVFEPEIGDLPYDDDFDDENELEYLEDGDDIEEEGDEEIERDGRGAGDTAESALEPAPPVKIRRRRGKHVGRT